jgi:hypothetical protein
VKRLAGQPAEETATDGGCTGSGKARDSSRIGENSLRQPAKVIVCRRQGTQ